MRKTIFRIITVLLISVMTVSCSQVTHDYFYGGEILDAEKMESIRADVVPSETNDLKVEETESESQKENPDNKHEETSKETSKETSNTVENTNDVLEEITNNESEGGEVVTNESDEKDSQESTNIATETEKAEEQDKVYWTEGGGVWHLFEDCGHLKNSKDVISGTEEEAKAAGKSKVCSSCNKKAN